MIYSEQYWNDKNVKRPIIYGCRTMRNSNTPIEIDVRNFISANDALLQKYIEQYNLKKETYNETALAIQKFIVNNFTYIGDLEGSGVNEFWQFAFESMSSLKGDCIATYEEIYTKDGIKKVSDLEVGDIVLSYDFQKKEYCYKPITKIWEKGKLERKRVHFRNGQHIDVTEDHPFWIRNSQKNSEYKKTKLSDVDLERWWKRKTPIAKEIPYNIVDLDWLTEELCLVAGHFVAEGWVDSSKVCSSGHELIEDIIPILEKYKIPFTQYTNNSNVPCINFLKSEFKDFLHTLISNSFNIHIPEYIFKLPKNKLEEFLRGFWIGDGHNGNYPNKLGYASNKQEVYSTSSEQFARDIQRIGLQLGRTFHIWKQEHHGGVGTKPIYRITYNTNSYFIKDYGYEGISEVSLRYIEDLESCEMRDFEVEDTHTYITKNGIICHNCEDGSNLMASLMINAGIPEYRVRVVAGYVKPSDTAPTSGHCYCTYLADRNDDTQEWVITDWCYYQDTELKCEDKPLLKDGGYNNCYKEIWWSFNSKYSWSKEEVLIEQPRVNK